jgi:hypothetical protein
MSSILSSILSKTLFTATNELTGIVLWPNLKIESVKILVASENTDSPMSTIQYSSSGPYNNLTSIDIGAIKIMKPSSIIIKAICPDIQTINGVISSFADQQLTFSVLTKGIITPSLVISSLEIEQTAEMLSSAEITITTERSSPMVKKVYTPAQSADATSIGSRLQTLSSGLTTTASNLYNTVSKAASSAVSSVTNLIP